MDKAACKTLKSRITYHYLRESGQIHLYHNCLANGDSPSVLHSLVPQELFETVISEKISDETLPAIFAKIDECKAGKEIDLIVGGPPCQVYSLVGRSKINSLPERHVSKDIRYDLYRQYGKFLQKYKPKYFIFENVLGILSAEKSQLIRRIQKFFEEECGYKFNIRVVRAYEYGVLQRRLRVIIIGQRGDAPFQCPEFERVKRSEDWTVLNSILSDLEPLNAGEEKNVSRYSTPNPNDYLRQVGIRGDIEFVTQHVTRPHNERDLAIYRIAIEKWKQGERLKYNDLPEELRTHQNVTAFLDRFKVVDPNGLSHTVVAHLSKDGHYYIYPNGENPRSLSVREAARIQSFPDDYYFEGGKGAAFRQIGNAVPPQLAFVIAKKMKELLLESHTNEYASPNITSRGYEPVSTP